MGEVKLFKGLFYCIGDLTIGALLSGDTEIYF